MLRVRELVNILFPGQHPQVEGPDTRVHFSTEEETSQVLLLKVEDDTPVIQAGSVAEVRQGNRYSIVPLDGNRADGRAQIAQATVTHVTGFRALVDLSFTFTEFENSGIPPEGALCYLESEALHQWPVKLQVSEAKALEGEIEKSKYLRICDVDSGESPLVWFRGASNWIALQTKHGGQIAKRYTGDETGESSQSYRDIVADAEKVARAQHLLSLQIEDPTELLLHNVEVEVGLVEGGKPARILKPELGDDHVKEGEKVYINLTNNSTNTVYVFIFDIKATGTISLTSASCPTGIRLEAGQIHTIGSNRFGQLKGLPFIWPKGIPMDRPIDERLLFIFTSSPVGQLILGSDREESGQGNYQSGDQGDQHQSDESITRLVELPSPETLMDSSGLPTFPPNIEQSSKGIFGGVYRVYKKTPAWVWVVNRHTEDITVIVSKYRPSRILTEAGLDVSATGVGFNMASAVVQGPATRKIIHPQDREPIGAIAVFPIWTRRDGFCVITIFKGSEGKPYIENDRIPLGPTAYFVNRQNLEVVEYNPEAS